MIYKASTIKAILRSKLPSKKKRILLALSLIRKQNSPHRKLPRHMFRRNRGFAIDEMARLPDGLFRRMFRVDRPTFTELVQQLSPLIEKDETYAINAAGTPITATTRVAVTLRWLAGGSSLDLCFAWGISRSTFYSKRGVIWPTIEAIDSLLQIGLPINDNAALSELATAFGIHSHGNMNGAIMAIDGLAVKTRCPYKWEVNNRRDYRNRKGGFGIVVLAGCDVRGKFMFAITNHAGSTNDIIAWEDSTLYHAIKDGRLPKEFFIIGDEAFTNTNQVLSPWPGRGLGPYKDAFNFWLSHSRQCIERAFGMLTQRWGIFWRRFHFAQSKWALVTQVCMKLHNLCIDKNVPVPRMRFHEDFAVNDEWVVIPNEQPDDHILRGHATGDRRRLITEDFERRGVVRPPHARSNSRA